MDLKIKDRYFVVGGAGSGFGRAICQNLAMEGARVLAVSRTEEKLITLKNEYPHNIEYLCGDITTSEVHDKILLAAKENKIAGIVFNASGPPVGANTDITMQMWDDAWKSVVRWKIQLAKSILPTFIEQNYGRLLFIESVSVVQPVKNLILSNALRQVIVGFAKTVSQEVASQGVTLNILAPGYHNTAAMERLYTQKAKDEGISINDAKQQFEKEIPVGAMGKPDEMASIALWLLSPLSRYVTGQTITHDGGLVTGY